MTRGRCFRPAAATALRSALIGGPLVVVTGEPGVGKSWLARSVVGALADDGVARALVVQLADLAVVGWWAAIAAAIDGLDDASLEGGEAVLRWLDAHAPVALLLDTLIAPADALTWLAGWLDEVPTCRVMLVSRRGFDGPTVQRFDVSPLATPPPDGSVLAGPAAAFWRELLERMAIAVEPSEEVAHVELVRLLEGLPLAMELAAPRLRVMRPTVLLHRLRGSRSALRGADGVSLDAAFDRSWRVLEERDRRALTSLSVVASPFSLVTADALLGHDAASLLERLVDHGWLRSVPDGTALLESMADFVRRRIPPATLVAAETEVARALVRGDAASSDGSRQRRVALARAALRPRLERAHAEAVLALVARDRSAAALILDGWEPAADVPPPVVDAVLDASRGSGADPALWGEAWRVRATTATRRGAWDDAVRALGHAQLLAEGRGDARGEASVSLGWARLELARGAAGQAIARAESAREQWARLRDEPGEIGALAVLAEAQALTGDTEVSAQLWARLVARCRGEWRDAARLRGAWLLADIERRGEAEAWLAAIVTPGLASARRTVEAWLAHDNGDHATAEHAYGEAIVAAGRAARSIEESVAITGLGLLRLAQGGHAEASALFHQAQRAAEAAGAGDWGRLAVALQRRADASLPPALRAPRVVVEGGPRGSRADRLAEALDANQPVPLGIAGRLLMCVGEGVAAEPVADALVVHPEGRWFRVPGEDAVSLLHRPVVARVLAALVEGRRAQPGQALGYEALVERGWPGERMRGDAGAHRVRVAISTLRKLGLRRFVSTVEGGYCLDPGCPLVVQPA